MKFLLFVAGAVLLAATSASPTSAQHTMLPDLVGTWESATGGMQLVDGPSLSLEPEAPGARAKAEITISKQNGESRRDTTLKNQETGR